MSEYSCLWLYFHFWPKNMKSTWYLRFVLYAPRSTVQCVAVDIILIEASRLAISAFISWMSPSTLLISWLHFLKIIHTSKNHRSQTLLRFFFSTFNFLPQHWNRYQETWQSRNLLWKMNHAKSLIWRIEKPFIEIIQRPPLYCKIWRF